MIEYDVRTKLLATSGVTTITGSGTAARIYVDHLPQNPVYPALVISLVSDVPEYAISGAAGVREARIQIDCLAHEHQESDDGYHTARTLGEAVITALSGFRGMAGSSEVQGALLQVQRPAPIDEVGVYRVTQDWDVPYAG